MFYIILLYIVLAIIDFYCIVFNSIATHTIINTIYVDLVSSWSYGCVAIGTGVDDRFTGIGETKQLRWIKLPRRDAHSDMWVDAVMVTKQRPTDIGGMCQVKFV
jgi:hypothetical protein